MTELRDGQVELKVFGMPHVNNEEVPATVFADKIKALVAALKAADASAHGRNLHEYTIFRLHTSEPTAILQERPLPKLLVSIANSAIPIFSKGVEDIGEHASRSKGDAKFAGAIASLTRGARKRFDYGTVRTAKSVQRLDDFLHDRARAAKRASEFEGIPKGGWFRGTVESSFDGKLQFVDTRGPLPQIKLTLSSGGLEIDCVCRREDVDLLGEALEHRVRVYGKAIYDGSSGLPRRVIVREIKPVGLPGNFERWKGAFEPFELASWDGLDA